MDAILRIFCITLLMLAAALLAGCESSSSSANGAPELGNVRVAVLGLDGILDLSLNGSEPVRFIGSSPAYDNESSALLPRRDTAVFDQLLENGAVVDIEVTTQPDGSFCELVDDQEMVFNTQSIAYFNVYCMSYRKGPATTTGVDISGTHACAIVNGQGRCYSDNASIRSLPEGLSEPQLIKSGHGFSCGAQANELFCWGDNAFLSAPAPQIVGDIKELELDFDSGCLIDGEGLKCWGQDSSPVVAGYPRDLTAPQNLVIKDSNACVLDEGIAHCWGHNVSNSDLPEDLVSVVDIDIGLFYGCAVTESSSVICWPTGAGAVDHPIVAPEDLGGASAIAVSHMTACATTDNGVRCWGPRRTPLSLTDRIISYPGELVLSSHSGCAIEEGELICFGAFVSGRDNNLLTPSD